MNSGKIVLPPYTITLNGVQVNYMVRRSERAKHIRIVISAHSGVVVVIPARVKRYINPESFLKEKEEWVLKHLSKAAPPPAQRKLGEGSKLTYRGLPRTLMLHRNCVTAPRVELTHDEVKLHIPSSYHGDLREPLLDWYREEAEVAIRREVEAAAESIGVAYKRVTIRDQRTKWGSCSRQGNLSFNWRLILFPGHIMRYVVIHELCHLRHFNHSKRFWSLVEHHIPDYQFCVRWLRDNGAMVEDPLR